MKSQSGVRNEEPSICHNCEVVIDSSDNKLEVTMASGKSEVLKFCSEKCSDDFTNWFENAGHLS